MDLLPEDILVQILVRLPVKCLLRFRCVSKAWCSLIKSPRFVDLHLSRAKSSDEGNVILVKRFIKDERKTVLSFHSHDESLSLQVVAPDFEVPFLTDYKMLLIGICNGIICLSNCDSEEVYLYNPATREFLTLPDLPFGCPQGFLRHTAHLGFGFDPTDDDYKIINIISHPDDSHPYYFVYKAEIYSLNTNSWRELDANSTLRHLVYFPCYSVSFNGCFHWCKKSTDSFGFKILSFDISTEQFREIQYPDGVVDPETGIGWQTLDVLDNLLALICYSSPQTQISDQHIDIWVMMEYGVQDSWIKKFSIGPLSGVQCPISS